MAEQVKERRILVAVDESEESMYALQWCLTNLIGHHSSCSSSKDTIILLYARPSLPVYTPMDGTVGFTYAADVTATMEKYSLEVADSVMEKAKNVCKGFTNIKVETKVCTGDARDVICDMVNKLGVDMLVIGSHGYGFIRRALLGSVSDHCARNAKCPVIIAKRQ